MRRQMAFTPVAEHLAVVMPVHVVRPHLAGEPHGVSVWPAGLGDPVVATAPASLHNQPARAWTEAESARAVVVS